MIEDTQRISVYITGRPNSLQLTWSKVRDRFLTPFFAPEDVRQAEAMLLTKGEWAGPVEDGTLFLALY